MDAAVSYDRAGAVGPARATVHVLIYDGHPPWGGVLSIDEACGVSAGFFVNKSVPIDERTLRALQHLKEKIKTHRLRRHWFLSPELTAEERALVYGAAKDLGLLGRYEFNGLISFGVDRKNAGNLLLERTRQKAFELFKLNFGSRAHFWVRPEIGFDFYWRLAKLGVDITGPTFDDARRGDPRRTRDSRPDSDAFYEFVLPGGKALKIPYYVIWHRPSLAVSGVRAHLVASGRYPKLTERI